MDVFTDSSRPVWSSCGTFNNDRASAFRTAGPRATDSASPARVGVSSLSKEERGDRGIFVERLKRILAKIEGIMDLLTWLSVVHSVH